MKITREFLESLAGKKVKIKLFDNNEISGILELGNGYFFEAKRYSISCYCFRLSHIKKLEVVR